MALLEHTFRWRHTHVPVRSQDACHTTPAVQHKFLWRHWFSRADVSYDDQWWAKVNYKVKLVLHRFGVGSRARAYHEELRLKTSFYPILSALAALAVFHCSPMVTFTSLPALSLQHTEVELYSGKRRRTIEELYHRWVSAVIIYISAYLWLFGRHTRGADCRDDSTM